MPFAVHHFALAIAKTMRSSIRHKARAAHSLCVSFVAMTALSQSFRASASTRFHKFD